jgi:hypothetical protein
LASIQKTGDKVNYKYDRTQAQYGRPIHKACASGQLRFVGMNNSKNNKRNGTYNSNRLKFNRSRK